MHLMEDKLVQPPLKGPVSTKMEDNITITSYKEEPVA
jgi:hypothetical protein